MTWDELLRHNLTSGTVGTVIGTVIGVFIGVHYQRWTQKSGGIIFRFSESSLAFKRNDRHGEYITTTADKALHLLFNVKLNIFCDKGVSAGLSDLEILFCKGCGLQTLRGPLVMLKCQPYYSRAFESKIIQVVSLPSRDWVALEAFLMLESKDYDTVLSCNQVFFASRDTYGKRHCKLIPNLDPSKPAKPANEKTPPAG